MVHIMFAQSALDLGLFLDWTMAHSRRTYFPRQESEGLREEACRRPNARHCRRFPHFGINPSVEIPDSKRSWHKLRSIERLSAGARPSSRC